jgi:hypothetical protein
VNTLRQVFVSVEWDEAGVKLVIYYIGTDRKTLDRANRGRATKKQKADLTPFPFCMVAWGHGAPPGGAPRVESKIRTSGGDTRLPLVLAVLSYYGRRHRRALFALADCLA